MFPIPVIRSTRIVAALCAASLMVLAQPAAAQSAPPPPAPAPAAERSASPRAPELTLAANAASEVDEDTVTISLAAEVEAPDQIAAGKKLTAALDSVMKQAKGVKGVDARSGGYNVWAMSNNKGKTTSWRGQGEIVLESKDFAAASELAAKLGDRVTISNIRFSLSRDKREAEERKLLTQAASAFRERALAATAAFGFSGYRIAKLEVGGSGGETPQPRMMAMAARGKEASDANVPLESGKQTVTVVVNGTVVLQ